MGLLIKFSIALENSAKPIEWGRPGKLVHIFLFIKCVSFSIRLPSCSILHHMGNA